MKWTQNCPLQKYVISERNLFYTLIYTHNYKNRRVINNNCMARQITLSCLEYDGKVCGTSVFGAFFFYVLLSFYIVCCLSDNWDCIDWVVGMTDMRDEVEVQLFHLGILSQVNTENAVEVVLFHLEVIAQTEFDFRILNIVFCCKPHIC